MAQAGTYDAGRGRESTRPRDIPKAGWRDILLRTKDQISKDNVGLIAAGIAFYGLLGLFPAVAALVSIYGLIADPQQVQQQLQMASGVIPQGAMSIIGEQMTKVSQGSSGALSFAAAASILVALWGASKGVKAFMQAMNIAYGEEEKRGFFRLNAVALLLTLFVIGLAVFTLVGVVAVPAVINFLGLGDAANLLISVLRWPLIALVLIGALAVLYRYAPSRRPAQWRWVSPGSITAIVFWLIASIAFSIYVRNFGSYNETYGSLGAVVGMLMWLWLSAFVFILGAELNAESERQTNRDSTIGKGRGPGKRGAYAADTLGEQR